MLKHRIYDIYKDGNNLFVDNSFINSDTLLSDFVSYFQRFDLIAKYDYGAREILTQFLDETELDYNLTDIHEAIYMNFLKNLRKYEGYMNSDESAMDVSPSNDYKITRQYGEEEKHFNYGNKTGQDSYSQKENTNQYGQRQTTDVLGQGQQTVTTAPRSTDSQDQRTTFDSTTDYDTNHNTTSTIQTVDTVADASRTNTSTEALHSDTLTEGAHTVTKTEQSHSDNVVYDEHTDNVYGYKGNPTSNIIRYREYWDENVFKMIIADCINTVTYSIYLYTGQM